MSTKVTISMVNRLLRESLMEVVMPSRVVNMNSFYSTTSPIFNFDLFTGSNLSDVAGSKVGGETRAIPNILKKAHQRMINDKKGSNPIDALKFLIQLFGDPATQLGNVNDLDSDQSTTDDQITSFFTLYTFYSFLDNLVSMNETSMGFQLENWLALVLGGEAQTSGATQNVYDLKDSSGTEYSLKFYVRGGDISQSASNVKDEQSYNYIIAIKDSPKPKTIKFYSGSIGGADLVKGVSIENFIKEPTTIFSGEINIPGFKTRIEQIMKNDASQSQENIIKFTSQFGRYIEQLKIFLSFWFLEMTENPDSNKLSDAASGIKTSSENCIFSLNSLATNSLSLKAPTQQPSGAYTSAMEQILSQNKALVRTMELPNIRVDQIHGQKVNQKVVKDFILNKISDVLSQQSTGDILKDFQNSIFKIREILNSYMKQIGNKSFSIAECFSALVILDSFKYLFDLRSAKSDSDIGGGPGSAVAGFIFENFISIFGNAGGMSGYSIGGNDQKIDYCIVLPPNSKGQKFQMLGFSSKSQGKEITHLSSTGNTPKAGKFIGDNDYESQNAIWQDYPVFLLRSREFLDSNGIKDAQKMNSRQVFNALVKMYQDAYDNDKGAEFVDKYNDFFKNLRAVQDTGNSSVVWISCVKSHCDDGKSTPQMKAAVDKVISKAKQIAIEKQYDPEHLGTLFGATRKRRVYKALIQTEEYEKYMEELDKTYDLKIGMFGNPVDTDKGTISISMGPTTQYSDDAEFKTAFEIAAFDVNTYYDTIKHLKDQINKNKDNFLLAFDQYNRFKIASSSFLDDPTQNAWNISYTSYDNFKKLANELFKSQNLSTQITESSMKITASFLKKLIQEKLRE